MYTLEKPYTEFQVSMCIKSGTSATVSRMSFKESWRTFLAPENFGTTVSGLCRHKLATFIFWATLKYDKNLWSQIPLFFFKTLTTFTQWSDLHCPAHLWSASSIRMWIEVKLGWGELQEHSNAGPNHWAGEGDGDGGGGGGEAVWIKGDGVGGKVSPVTGSSLFLNARDAVPEEFVPQLKGKVNLGTVRSTAGFSCSL